MYGEPSTIEDFDIRSSILDFYFIFFKVSYPISMLVKSIILLNFNCFILNHFRFIC